MMTVRIPALLAATALVAACSSEPEQAPAGQSAQLTLYDFMTQKIDGDADVIWGIGNKALDDKAAMDPALMSAEDWKTLQEAAARMAEDARALASVDPLVVKPEGVTIADEGTPGAPTTEQIEGHIARDHDLFRSLAETLANHADELSRAAAAKDEATAGRLINELDGVCESCHLEFWYPEQKKLMQEMGIAAK